MYINLYGKILGDIPKIFGGFFVVANFSQY